MQYLPCEIIETNDNVDAAIIWLHGLGASGHDFMPIVPRLNLSSDMAIRFIFPHAPSIPITINNGMVMPGWYDIYAMDMEREIDFKQLMASSKAITDLIDQQCEQGIASQRIIIAGFSQGGAVAIQAALTYTKPLAGLMSLSSYFATHKTINPAKENANIPVCIYHGTHDSIVPPQLAEHTQMCLRKLGYHPEYKTYPMAHEVYPQQIEDMSHFIHQCLE
jgi:phospholipase/carboxylesterase